MKNETDSEMPSAQIPLKSRTNFLKRFWNAYQYKKHTDQSFLATVVAFQVTFILIFFLTVALLVVEKSHWGSADASIFFKAL
jgi:hypothetical protein